MFLKFWQRIISFYLWLHNCKCIRITMSTSNTSDCVNICRSFNNGSWPSGWPSFCVCLLIKLTFCSHSESGCSRKEIGEMFMSIFLCSISLKISLPFDFFHTCFWQSFDLKVFYFFYKYMKCVKISLNLIQKYCKRCMSKDFINSRQVLIEIILTFVFVCKINMFIFYLIFFKFLYRILRNRKLLFSAFRGPRKLFCNTPISISI